MASASMKRRSTRQMASRKRSQYIEPETEDDLISPDEDESDFDLPRELAPSPRKRRRIVKIQHTPKTRSKSATKKVERASPKRRKKTKTIEIGRPRRARQTTKQVEKKGIFAGPSDGRVPPWATLPEQILKDIFIFAGQPVTASNTTWLVGAARTCRAFVAPALEALYYWPPIWRPASLHQLLHVLKHRDGRLLNYNTKVKRLDVDLRRLTYTAANKALFELSDLVRELPRLQHFEIVHPEDEPPYRPVSLPGWHYPNSLFSSLVSTQICLTSWRWTFDMIKNRTSPYEFMTEIHLSKTFQTLQELILCGFPPTVSNRLPTPNVDGEIQEPDLSSAINVLNELKDVSLISCDVVEKDWLSTLPVQLERLELSNCQYIYPDGLIACLASSGSRMRELVLNHNPAIDLSFLPSLRISCPRLEVLEMDLHFYSRYLNISQMEPEYDELLQADEVPTWPTTMRQIDLVHMQKWNSSGANNLFRSVVDSAPELPDLRFIVLHSHIDIPWRDRAKFRDDWIDKLQHVFKRPSKAPFAHNGSNLQYKLWQQARSPARKLPMPTESADSPAHSPSHVPPPEGIATACDAAQRRSRRVADASEALQQRLQSAEPQPVSNEPSNNEEDPEEGSSDYFQHRLCDVVDVRIDNQRPRENQLTEQDFLDSEASGDEDWHNDAVAEGDDYAW